MKKSDYVRIYGEDAYKVHLEKCKQNYQKNKEKIAERQKQYYQKNKEHIVERQKQYYQDNKEHIVEQKKQYYQDNREHIAEQQKQYNQDNREHIAEYQKQYYQDNREHIAEYQKQYYNETEFGRASQLISTYRQSDNKYNRGECTLTHQWVIDKIFGATCYYCGCDDWHQLGADRIDNSKPHTPENCVPCCCRCNLERHTMDFHSFVEKKKGVA